MKTQWLSYWFEVYDPEITRWNDKAGIYVFAGATPQNYWKALYIGQTESFSSRIPNHKNWASAARLGATHVHALVVPLAANRDSIEAELIEAYQPALNVQLK